MFISIKKPKGCVWVQVNESSYKGVRLEKFPELFNAGYILLTEYTDIKKVQELIELGDIYFLREEPTSKTTLDKIYECEYLHRDFDEPFHQYITNDERGTKRAEYNYLFKKNLNGGMSWYFNLCENYQLLSHDWIEDEINNPTMFRNF